MGLKPKYIKDKGYEVEDDFIDSIAEMHPNFESQKSRRVFFLHFSEFAQNMWFYKFFDRLKASTYGFI